MPRGPVPEAQRCLATTKAGGRCPSRRWRGSAEYCYLHDATQDQARKEAAAKGGRHTGKRHRAVLPMNISGDVETLSHRATQEALDKARGGEYRPLEVAQVANILDQMMGRAEARGSRVMRIQLIERDNWPPAIAELENRVLPEETPGPDQSPVGAEEI